MINGIENTRHELSIRPACPADYGIDHKPGVIIDVKKPQGFAPVKGQTLITESGYYVHIEPMIGSSTKVTKLGGGYYLVATKPSVYGAKTKTTVMTEEELVEKFHGVKLPVLKDKKELSEKEQKIQEAVIELITMNPVVYYNA